MSEAKKTPSQYMLIYEQGNKVVSKEAFIFVNAYFHRFIQISGKQYNTNYYNLHLLSCLQAMTIARGNNKPFALTTLSRNFFVPFVKKKAFIAMCMTMHETGLITMQYSGRIKGAKVSITHLGINAIDQMYKDYLNTMLTFPFQG